MARALFFSDKIAEFTEYIISSPCGTVIKKNLDCALSDEARSIWDGKGTFNPHCLKEDYPLKPGETKSV